MPKINAQHSEHLRPESFKLIPSEIDHQRIGQSQNSFRKSNSEIKEHSDAITQVYIKFFRMIVERSLKRSSSVATLIT